MIDIDSEYRSTADTDLIREVRAARTAYGESFGFDLDAIVADLARKEAQGHRPVRKAPIRPEVVELVSVAADPPVAAGGPYRP